MLATPTKRELLNFLTFARSTMSPCSKHELATTLPKARIFTISRGPFLYTLTTWGNGAFMQIEIVFYKDCIIWSMSLQGRVIITSATKPARIDSKEFSQTIFDFVQTCRREPNNYRFSPGPNIYTEGRLKYECITKGVDYSWLQGTEEVYKCIEGENYPLFTSAFQAQILLSS